MAADREVTFADIERAVAGRDPQLADLIVRFLQQGDPPAGQPEEPPDDLAPGESMPAPPRDAWTLDRLRAAVGPQSLYSKTRDEQRAARSEAWEAMLAVPNPPPRLRLGKLLIDLYKEGDEAGRSALIETFKRCPIQWGVWQALKHIYKLSEQRHDALMFGVLAWRLDTLTSSDVRGGEIGQGTLIYMRRRAWRYLRHLGQAVPELYPQFVVQVLRHYPAAFGGGSWILTHVWAHEDVLGDFYYVTDPPKELKKRAFHEAWKLAPQPLLRLLEDAQNDKVCRFAIGGLEEDFKEVLRDVNPQWLARIGKKRLGSVDGFVIKLLTDNPQFHQSKLRDLGLHQLALDLLFSPNREARKYAVDYARAHAKDLGIDELVKLAADGAKEVKELAATRLAERSAKELGLTVLVRLVGIDQTNKLATEKLKEFSPDNLDEELYLTLALGNRAQQDFVEKFYSNAKKKVPAAYLCKLLEQDRCGYRERNKALKELSKRPGTEIGLDWFKEAVLGPHASEVGRWLREGKLKGDDLDVEWVKGMTMRPQLRNLALALLGDRKLIDPGRIGLPWLLAMARQADEQLHSFAHRYLLENFTPEDFALEMNSTDVEVGIDKLWSLAGGKDEPESVRAFASTYLRVHHPEIGPTMKEARSLGIKPKLKRESYTLNRVLPLLTDGRADVRRLAATIATEELVRWGDRDLLYRLADSAHRETRGAAAAVLLGIGEPDADPKKIPGVDWLSAPAVFALAESTHKPTREVAVTLIRRHYERIGGAKRLAWLMESPDREVRIFAARLLWDRHRPVSTPAQWRPAKGEGLVSHDAGRFESTAALRQFVRTIMFGLPPGRMERREPTDGRALPDRPLPASVAKKRLLDVVRDLSLEDREFAELALPVLEEFMQSQAKGEWQGCVASLAAIRQAHPQLETALPAGFVAEGTAARDR